MTVCRGNHCFCPQGWGTPSRKREGPSLVDLWVRLCLPVLGVQVWFLVSELRSYMTLSQQTKTKTAAIEELGLPWWLSGKESVCQCRRPRFDLWVRKIPWRRKWQPTLVFFFSISHMVIYMFQCCSLKSFHPRLFPQSPKVCSLHLCLFCCPAYRVIVTIFLNSIYMH